MTGRWRLLVDGAADGAWNMAVDEALLEGTAVTGIPVLRLYRWSPACLSIGALQAVGKSLAPPLGEIGHDWVRRPSGGRALLHDDELTYALAVPEGHWITNGGVRASSHRIAGLLKTVLVALGVTDVALAPIARRRSASPACYAAPSDYELLVSGRKLIGSAQLRTNGGILQHGSVPIRSNPERLVRRLATVDEVALLASLTTGSTDLASALGEPPNDDQLHSAFQVAWNAVGLYLLPGELTQQERARATLLAGEKYRATEWAMRR